jgi:hypothetical protein
VARCQICLLAEHRTSSPSSTTLRGKCALIRLEQKIAFLRSSRNWLAMVENQTDRKRKCLQCDNGGGYKSDEFIKFCRERSIRCEYTASYNREQNGVAERLNRTMQERIVSMLHHSALTDNFLAEALLAAVHIINMSLSRPFALKIPQRALNRTKTQLQKATDIRMRIVSTCAKRRAS